MSFYLLMMHGEIKTGQTEADFDEIRCHFRGIAVLMSRTMTVIFMTVSLMSEGST